MTESKSTKKSAVAGEKAKKSFPNIKVVRLDEGNPIWLAHSLYETKCNEPSLSVFKMTSPPHTSLAPLHAHPFDEFLLVTAGLVVWFYQDEEGRVIERHLEAGDCVFFEAGTLEGFKTLGQSAEMYWFMIGDDGTSEEFFELNGEPAVNRHVPAAVGYDYQAPSHKTTQENAHEVGFAVVPDLVE